MARRRTVDGLRTSSEPPAVPRASPPASYAAPSVPGESRPRRHRCRADTTVAQALGIEPVFVELEAIRQDVANGLMQARGQQAAGIRVSVMIAYMDRTTTGAAILAGGRARRFGGRDKSRLVVEGRTIIVRQLDILQRVACRGRHRRPASGPFRGPRPAVHADRVAGAGALGGIAHGARGAPPRVLSSSSPATVPFLTRTRCVTRLVALADGL